MKQFLRKHKGVLLMVGAFALAKILNIELPPYLLVLSLVDNFDSYSDGDLNGQGSWTGSVLYDVQGVTVQAGTKAGYIAKPASSAEIYKTFTAAMAGKQLLYVRNTATDGYFSMQFMESGGTYTSVFAFNTNGYFQILDSTANWNNIQTYVANQWYKVQLEWRDNAGTTQCRVIIDDGTPSSWYNSYLNQTTGTNKFNFNKGNNGTANSYFDSFSDPNAGSTSPSISPSESPSQSISPSISPSISISISPSESPSVSPSQSLSPSISPSISPSVSPSFSPSPSPGWEYYTKGDYADLPAGIADLENNYSSQDYLDVDTKNDVRVGQTATSQYAIHQYKDYVGTATECILEWEGQTNCSPTLSTAYLQIFNRNTPTWETVDTDNSSAENTDFILTASIPDLTNYKDASNAIVCRVYQLDI